MAFYVTYSKRNAGDCFKPGLLPTYFGTVILDLLRSRGLTPGLNVVRSVVESWNISALSLGKLFERGRTQIEHQKQLDEQLDLYLSEAFPKEVLTERKTRLEQMLAKLRTEQNGISEHIGKMTMSDDQLVQIETFCARINPILNHLISTLDLRSLTCSISAAKSPLKIARKRLK